MRAPLRRLGDGAAALAAAGIAASMAMAVAPAAVSAGSHPVPGRETLSGSLASARAREHPVGGVARSSRVSFELVLKLRDPAGAAALVRAVSTPGSRSYRHYLTTRQWEARFSPSAAEVSAARGWLRREGFGVGAVSADRITVSAWGTAAQVEQAFATRLARFKLNGRVVRLATRQLSVPAPVAGSVAGTLGINQYIATPAVAASAASPTTSRSPGGKFPPPPAAFVTPPPCGTYYGQKTATVSPPFGHGYPGKVPDQVCGYKPAQLRSAYYLNPADTGQGTTVAVIDAYGSATITGDATRYFSRNDPGLPFASAHFSQNDAFPFNQDALCAASSWLEEQALDVEAVHSMAPGAHILYVGAKNCINGLFTAEQQVIDYKMADVITNSWSVIDGDLFADAAYRTAFDDLLMLADSTGITVLFSTGDVGDGFVLTGISAAQYPAESPYATGVGGTSLKVAAHGQQTGQLGWATGDLDKCTQNLIPKFCPASKLGSWLLPVFYQGGSGGFTSYNYIQPAYQHAVVPASLAHRNEPITGPERMRVIPDISMDADPSTGMLIGEHEVFRHGKVRYGQYRIGGTSLASPLLAGVIVDTDQAARAAGHGNVGFINPAIYALHASPHAMDDIKPGGKQALWRVDQLYSLVGGNATGLLYNFWELTYEGPIIYCDQTGNCATRDNTLSTANGYDSMTGLGSIGPGFIPELAK